MTVLDYIRHLFSKNREKKTTVMNFLYSILILCIVTFLATKVHSCNEFVCGSVVSKCLLTQSCQCKLTDCFCCKDCLNCLGDLYTECCSCLEMCPTQNATEAALSPKSQIGDFDGIAALFDTLTEFDDDKWTIYRFPMKAGLKKHFDETSRLRDDIDLEAMQMKASSVKASVPVPVVNCTVIFLNTCTSNKKCMQYCESMGANSYRWFHDGCCECVGAECINYGINESKCQECPEPSPEEDLKPNMSMEAFEEDYEDEDMWDYGGEEEFNFN
ncbi:protein twisted gastrulation [Eupeodes corollae]|uniref:protein twisted gastrulation n=1 Tax=Eupeodes corollae TaxID=290404 RepID=UPI002492FB25|nr:protein twisted gastrulation [Eupeodes corollae]